MNKKFEFDLKVGDPKTALVNVIEKAGYHYHDHYFSESSNVTAVVTRECATCKKDVVEFIKKINKAAGIELILSKVEADLPTMLYSTDDYMFTGSVIIPGECKNGADVDIEDTRFKLYYYKNILTKREKEGL